MKITKLNSVVENYPSCQIFTEAKFWSAQNQDVLVLIYQISSPCTFLVKPQASGHLILNMKLCSSPGVLGLPFRPSSGIPWSELDLNHAARTVEMEKSRCHASGMYCGRSHNTAALILTLSGDVTTQILNVDAYANRTRSTTTCSALEGVPAAHSLDIQPRRHTSWRGSGVLSERSRGPAFPQPWHPARAGLHPRRPIDPFLQLSRRSHPR